MISRIIQLKNVFAENHVLVSVIDIVPYSSKPPLKLGCIEMQIGRAYTMVQHGMSECCTIDQREIDKICGRSLSSKIPVDMNSIFMKLYVTWPTWPKGHIPQKFLFSKPVIFVVFRLMKNIIFNKPDSFVGRNTSDHACQIFCSKSNCETMYHWFFLLEITVVKIMINLNVCSAHSYLYPQSRFKPLPNFNHFISVTKHIYRMSYSWTYLHTLILGIRWFK